MNWKVLAAVVSTLSLLAWIHFDGVSRGELKGKLEVTDLREQLATARADAQTALIAHQRQIDAQAKEMTDVHNQEMGDLQRSAVDSRNAADGMRGELAALQSRLRNQPTDSTGTGFQLSAATKAAMVLSELLSSCSAERSELARAFDDSHARGVGLEKQYDSLFNSLNKAP
jgi:hypothetical protein